MKRTIFDRENRIVGRDFSKLIEEEGGKSAGLHLLVDGIKGFSPKRKQLGFSDWHTIPTSKYREFERMLDKSEVEELLDNPLELLETPSIRNLLEDILQDCEGAFPEEYAYSLEATAPAWAAPFHLRSSTTVEDFKDDRYFGTFLTQNSRFFYPMRPSFSEGGKNILEAMLVFYAMKYSGNYDLADNAALGLVLMLTVGEYQDRHVTVYSSYPERDSPVLIEVQEVEPFGLNPIELIEITGREINRYNANLGFNGESLNEEDTLVLAELALFFQRKLGYSVNIEAIVTDDYIVPVQIRPVPTLEVTELGELPKDAYLMRA